MSSVAQRSPRAGGLVSSTLEIALSVGGYYLLRAFDVGVFWALTAPAIGVAVIALVVTVRRRRIDLIGFLVLCEIAATITLSLATLSPRIAALREAAYILIAGLFCLVTLVYRTPLAHASTKSLATFGDLKREQAFERAWREVPEYRRWQRLLTAALGLTMVVTGVTKTYLLLAAPDDAIAHAVDVSNILTFVMCGALVAVSAVLIQRPRKIIDRLLEQT
ncbi:VC0807 family protein [Kutzneria sp. NPDC051319]|uniref:VC0807 family protein n=1 Tax=Kutzneria sp. NPDC051319 TaxID=3155047 RepID=UPI00342CA322